MSSDWVNLLVKETIDQTQTSDEESNSSSDELATYFDRRTEELSETSESFADNELLKGHFLNFDFHPEINSFRLVTSALTVDFPLGWQLFQNKKFQQWVWLSDQEDEAQLMSAVFRPILGAYAVGIFLDSGTGKSKLVDFKNEKDYRAFRSQIERQIPIAA